MCEVHTTELLIGISVGIIVLLSHLACFEWGKTAAYKDSARIIREDRLANDAELIARAKREKK